MPRLYDLVGHSQGTDRQHPRPITISPANEWPSKPLFATLRRMSCHRSPRCLEATVAPTSPGSGACRASGQMARWCTGWWLTVTAPLPWRGRGSRFASQPAGRACTGSLPPAPDHAGGDGLQTHRIRPAPLASGQRTPPVALVRAGARFENAQLIERPDASGGISKRRDQGGHETGRHVAQRKPPGRVRLLDGGCMDGLSHAGGPVDELWVWPSSVRRSISSRSKSAPPWKIGSTGLTADAGRASPGRGRPDRRPSAPGSTTGCRASATAPRTPP